MPRASIYPTRMSTPASRELEQQLSAITDAMFAIYNEGGYGPNVRPENYTPADQARYWPLSQQFTALTKQIHALERPVGRWS